MDKRRQELEELQDEIHLALLMDEYADFLGAQVRAEAEEAFASGELAIPCEVNDACRSILAQTTKPDHRKQTTRSLTRYIAVAAAIIVVLIGTLVVVQASGIDVFGKLASWTDSVFHYNKKANEPQEHKVGPYAEIEAALRDLGLPVEFAPSRLPEGFSVTSLQKAETPEMKFVGIIAKNKGKEIQISIAGYSGEGIVDNAQWEKTAQSAKQYTSNGRTYYLFENELGWTGSWTDGRYSVALFGFESIHDIELTIDSMKG